jgi:serine/threonine protein kinase/tetratricopeptide (TPR) repeat protein
MTASPDVKSVFGKAIELTSPADRVAYLDRVCGSDPALRGEVEGLLAALQRAGRFMSHPAVSPSDAEAPESDEAIGTVIGAYTLVEKLGEGGMGAVYLAEQERPVKRRVALKLIKSGVGSPQAVARFDLERQTLALMDHPNIAQVLDAGTTRPLRGAADDTPFPDAYGRSYVVMELVNGIPITRFCDQERMTLRERLELFLPVCHAVQHAHQKGIIHRDLKPSNVLIAQYDGRPAPKVIDFGVAKAVGSTLSERVKLTEVGVLVGTLEYMAPEQAELNNLDVDTRADIYSLGVLLYELLTGSPPFTSQQLRDGGFAEMLRLIKEVEPPKPSTRVSSSDELASIAATRRVEPKSLARLLTGELDWIVMKCLEKERGRRYETAEALATDIGRYLADEPVSAGPPSTGYRVRKFVRRYRKPLAVVAAFLLLLMASTIVSLGLASWALRERGEAREQKQLAETREQEAKERNAETEGVLDFVENQVFAAARPLGQEGGLGRDVSLRRAIEAALPRVEGQFPDQPLIEARLLSTIGVSLMYLGDAKSAEPLFRRALELRTARLGRDHPETLVSMNNLGRCMSVIGRLREALTLLEETLELRKARLGPDHPDTLRTLGNVITTYRMLGRIARAVELTEENLRLQEAKLGRDHLDTITSLSILGLGYLTQGRREDGFRVLEEALRRRQAKLGPKHPDTWRGMGHLADAHLRLGRNHEALELCEATLRLQEAELTRDHVDTLRTMDILGLAQAALGQNDAARQLYEEIVKRRTNLFGPNHIDTLVSMNHLANLYTTLGRHADAAKIREGIQRARGAHTANP